MASLWTMLDCLKLAIENTFDVWEFFPRGHERGEWQLFRLLFATGLYIFLLRSEDLCCKLKFSSCLWYGLDSIKMVENGGRMLGQSVNPGAVRTLLTWLILGTSKTLELSMWEDDCQRMKMPGIGYLNLPKISKVLTQARCWRTSLKNVMKIDGCISFPMEGTSITSDMFSIWVSRMRREDRAGLGVSYTNFGGPSAPSSASSPRTPRTPRSRLPIPSFDTGGS